MLPFHFLQLFLLRLNSFFKLLPFPLKLVNIVQLLNSLFFHVLNLLFLLLNLFLCLLQFPLGILLCLINFLLLEQVILLGLRHFERQGLLTFFKLFNFLLIFRDYIRKSFNFGLQPTSLLVLTFKFVNPRLEFVFGLQ